MVVIIISTLLIITILLVNNKTLCFFMRGCRPFFGLIDEIDNPTYLK